MFTNTAREAFSDSPDGRRLFDLYGWPRRPYVVPDADTERRLLSKQVRYHQVFFLALLLGLMVFIEAMYKPVLNEPAVLLFIAVVTVGGYVIKWIIFHHAVRGLSQSASRLRFTSRLKQLAACHSRTGLALRVVGSMLFLAGSVWLIVEQEAPVFGIIGCAFAISCLVTWCIALSARNSETRLDSTEAAESA